MSIELPDASGVCLALMDKLHPESLICSTCDENDQYVSPSNHVHRLCLPLQETCQQIQALLTTDGRQLIIIHRSKCHSLANAYAVGVEQVQQQIHKALTHCPSTISAAAENLAPSLSALHLAMVEGEKFIRSCMKGSHWLKKALTLALSSEAIDIHFHDLLWSVSVVGAAVGRILGDWTDLDNQLVQLNVQMGGDIWRILLGNDTAHMNQQMLDHEQQQLKAINNMSVDSRNGILRMYGLLKAAISETCADEDLSLVLSALEDLKDTVGSSSPSATSDQVIRRFANFIFHRLSNRPLERISAGKLPPYLWVDRQEFQILGSLGSGGYAPVYKVEWLGEKFAMKEFSHVGSMFGASTKLFEREAAIQASLQHPNVVQLVCCTESSDGYNCGLVMELMQGDLGSFIAKRMKKGCVPPFPLPIALDIMLQIAKGMEYLHSKHIMHRDLKSFNVLVTTSGSHQEPASDAGRIRAKISDFGMSKAKYMSSKYTTMHAGTTYWRAPEVFESTQQQVITEEDSTDLLHESETNNINAAKYTKTADVYSFAMVCYEILSGKIPFQDINVPASKFYQKLINGVRPGLPSSCPQILHSYIAKCWHADASQRPPFVEICRTLGYLKGVLLTLADPVLSLTQLSDPLVEKLVQLMDIPAGANNIPLNADHQEMCHHNPVEGNVQEVELENKEGHTAENITDVIIAKTLQTGDQSLWYCIHFQKFFEKIKRKHNMLRSLEKLGSSLLCKHKVDKSELRLILEKLGSCLLCKHRADKSELGISTSFLAQLKKQPAGRTHIPSTLEGAGGANGPGTSLGRDEVHGGAKGLGTNSDLKMFTVEELRTATKRFRKMLGQGGYGAVFWGRFPNGQEVAVKRLPDIPSYEFYGEGVVVPELRTVGLLRHSNLVPLRGWCLNTQEDELLLVYDFMPNGSLDKYLFSRSVKDVLEWKQRYKIVYGLAAALHYLHHECGGPRGLKVVHRDVKPSNVLLDAELNARLGDFGLAKLVEQQVQAQERAGGASSGVVAGTMGYMDPQYLMTGEMGTHSDVYSFGVVVLEVTCGRRVIDRQLPHGESALIPWLHGLPKRQRTTRAADPRLGGDYNAKEMKKLLDLGLLCTQYKLESRPTMALVLKVLQKTSTPRKNPPREKRGKR